MEGWKGKWAEERMGEVHRWNGGMVNGQRAGGVKGWKGGEVDDPPLDV